MRKAEGDVVRQGFLFTEGYSGKVTWEDMRYLLGNVLVNMERAARYSVYLA